VRFADDSFHEDELPQVLRKIADAIQSFRTDAGFEMQPTKLKIYIKGVSLQRARDLISACIDNDDSLASLRLLLDPACDCIQVDGLRVTGVPVGSPEFIANYVRSKAFDIVQDVAKLRIIEDDPLVHSLIPLLGFLAPSKSLFLFCVCAVVHLSTVLLCLGCFLFAQPCRPFRLVNNPYI
jgi:hypothetical protein